MLNRNTEAPILPNRCCTQPIFGRVHHSDWLNNCLPDKSVQLIIADPPYFEVKGSFDFVWKSFEEYLIDVEKWAVECKRLLADNGTLFWYGHAKKIAYAQIIFDKYFNLENNIAIEFNRQTKKSVEYLNCFAPVSERLLMYSKNENYLFFRTYLREKRIAKGYTIKQVAEKMGVYQALYGFYEQDNTGSQIPTEEQYKKLVTILDLEVEYSQVARHFNNFKKLFDIMSFDQEAHITGKYDHDTCKPETLTRVLILTCSRPNDLVLVPFAGSGTEVAMAIKEGRQAIGFDVEEKYCQMSNDRIKKVRSMPELFV